MSKVVEFKAWIFRFTRLGVLKSKSLTFNPLSLDSSRLSFSGFFIEQKVWMNNN
jgi:hypothetical protein